jgi:hypothetical protein
MARRSGNKWYLAGINGSDEVREVTLPVDNQSGILFTDQEGKSQEWRREKLKNIPKSIVFQPRGGFCYIYKNR